MSHKTFKKMWPNASLEETNVCLNTYTGEELKVFGMTKVKVQYNEQVATLRLFVVDGNGPCLFGRDWLTNQARLE
ncbi:hypothetical protein HOLleu_13899 [Holothuria leucospilota]|uniref:Uncharacterized protein n=1 Tax=Holothuria leucospilota TaxID=206669 RepID=A0A9Q1C7S8_HOLLE|nr:hypothetical protein HOLleu_13899 [Holothuria leucospilota]